MQELEYINWSDSAHWVARIALGTEDTYYKFQADWNSRDESWAVTISTFDEIVLIQNKKMILNTDLLANFYSPYLPECSLFPISENGGIERISKDNMIDGEVKLYHIKVGEV